MKPAIFHLKKVTFPREICSIFDPDIFSENKPAGSSFVYGNNRISGLCLRALAWAAEIMLHKVPWGLEGVACKPLA